MLSWMESNTYCAGSAIPRGFPRMTARYHGVMDITGGEHVRSLELFAGAGGLLRGCADAGMECVAAFELGHDPCCTLRLNHGIDPSNYPEDVLEGDVRDVDWGRWSGIDVITGGPPCQPFSLGGRARAADDPRDMFPTMTGAVAALMPRAFLVENVRGLLRPSFSDYHRYILLRLANPCHKAGEGETWRDHMMRLESLDRERSDYVVAESLVDAADYGVPQHRRRVIITGMRRDLGLEAPRMPSPTHSGAALKRDQDSGAYWERVGHADTGARAPGSGDPGLLPWVTVREALSPPVAADDPMASLRPRSAARAYAGHTGSDPDLPSKTVKAGVHGAPGGENMTVLDGIPVAYTSRDAARIQTFPDEVVFHGAYSSVMRQIGNAVPVSLADIAAKRIMDTLTER